MKVAIISSSFFESTFPLAKYLSKSISVDLYCVTQITYLNPPMFDISGHKSDLECGIYNTEASLSIIPSYVLNYFSNDQIPIQLIVFSGGTKVLTDIFTIRKMIRKLRKMDYDLIHFIGHYVLFPFIERKINAGKVVHTLHESLDRAYSLEPGRFKKLLLNYQYRLLCKKPVRLIFHSENIRKTFHLQHKKPLSLTHFIPFGMFEGYKTFTSSADFQFLNRPYFLYVGYIHPYKGVDHLIEAAKLISHQSNEFRIVIAGKDSTGLRNRYELPPNTILIDKYLSETEIVSLVKNCYAVILPYVSVSQSGIPNVSFCFNKPIIASNLEGLNYIIHNEINGLLIESQNSLQLQGAIIQLWEDKILYQKLVDNIANKVSIEWSDWQSIAEKTKGFYLKNE